MAAVVDGGGRAVAKASILMVAATMALNLAMVVFHRQMSVGLGNGYADLAAILGVLNMVGIMMAGAATWLARELAHAAALGGEARAVRRMGQTAPILLGGGALMALVLVALGGRLEAWLKLSQPRLVMWAAAVVLGGLLAAMARALLQGAHRFGLLALSYLAEAAGRVSLPALLVGPMGVSGSLAGSAGASLLAGGLAAPMLWSHRRTPVAEEADQVPVATWEGLTHDTLALALFSLMGYLDILVFKSSHGATDAAGVAFYSRAALVGKSFLYIAAAFNLVALPVISAAHARGQATRLLLARFLGGMLLVQLLGLGGLWLLTRPLLDLMVGALPGNQAMVPLVRAFALGAIPLALFQLLLYYSMAVRARGFARLLAVTAGLYYLALRVWHGTPEAVVACFTGAALTLLGLGLGLAWRADGRAASIRVVA